MPEIPTADQSNELTLTDQLKRIGGEFDVHREENEDDQAYGERIIAQLESMIHDLLETQDHVHILLEE